MTVEEQVSFFSQLRYDVTRQLLANERVEAKLDEILERTRHWGTAATTPSSVASGVDSVGEVDAPMSKLDIAAIALIHRVATQGTRIIKANRGRLRSIDVWIGDAKDPSFVPPSASDVPSRLSDLVTRWRTQYAELAIAERDVVITELAAFHHQFVSIHPFLDANGRVGRILLDQAADELLGQHVGQDLVSDPAKYFTSLREADRGNLTLLVGLIRAALE